MFFGFPHTPHYVAQSGLQFPILLLSLPTAVSTGVCHCTGNAVCRICFVYLPYYYVYYGIIPVVQSLHYRTIWEPGKDLEI